jgi:hypothetical protein
MLPCRSDAELALRDAGQPLIVTARPSVEACRRAAERFLANEEEESRLTGMPTFQLK